MDLTKKILSTAAILGIIAIVLGAFGAHKLKELLTQNSLDAFNTGVKYQIYHALFLLFLGVFDKINNKSRNLIFRLTCVGLLLFSGSIYLLSTQSISKVDFSSIGFVTPIGGTILITSWFVLLRTFLKMPNSK